MDRLTGAQYKKLQDALLEAFPTPDTLAEMVRVGLDENLHAIASGGSLSAVIFSLIQWVEARGRRRDLLVAAVAANPGNAALRSVAGELLPADALPRPTAHEVGPADGRPFHSRGAAACGGPHGAPAGVSRGS